MDQKILQFVAILHIIGGCLLPFLSFIDPIANILVEEVFPGIELSQEAHQQASYLITLFGPTIASWGILFLSLCNRYFEKPTHQTWLSMLAAILVWFIGDTCFSLMHGVYAALFINGIFATSLIIPLCLSRERIDRDTLDGY